MACSSCDAIGFNVDCVVVPIALHVDALIGRRALRSTLLRTCDCWFACVRLCDLELTHFCLLLSGLLMLHSSWVASFSSLCPEPYWLCSTLRKHQPESALSSSLTIARECHSSSRTKARSCPSSSRNQPEREPRAWGFRLDVN